MDFIYSKNNLIELMENEIIETIITNEVIDIDFLLMKSKDKIFVFTHIQDCSEDVHIEEIIGDLDNLLNTPLTMAEVVTDISDGVTWTFYKFATIKGYVTIRWMGMSNGYYSEEVDFFAYNSHKSFKESGFYDSLSEEEKNELSLED